MKRAFSLVEVLAAVALIGILVFLALPNIVQVRQDSEDSLATARREAIDMAIGSYIQSVGTSAANTAWTNAASATNPNQARYELVRPYLAYAPTNLTATDGSGYMPAGYSATLPATIVPLSTKTQ